MWLTECFRLCNNSVLEYELLNLHIPTINIFRSLVKSGIRVLVYRYDEIKVQSYFLVIFKLFFLVGHGGKTKSSWEKFYCSVYIQPESFIYLNLMVKNRKISIERYFKWWTSTKLVWTMYQNY
jgi:hypothetical protein